MDQVWEYQGDEEVCKPLTLPINTAWTTIRFRFNRKNHQSDCLFLNSSLFLLLTAGRYIVPPTEKQPVYLLLFSPAIKKEIYIFLLKSEQFQTVTRTYCLYAHLELYCQKTNKQTENTQPRAR